MADISSATRYPELRDIAETIANDACKKINRYAQNVESEMPYKAQCILEHVIEILGRRV